MLEVSRERACVAGK